jgi:sulfonate transport system substrate-binding protein
MLQAMGPGRSDVGGVGNAPPVFAAAGGSKIAIVGAYQANPLGSALLVPKGSPITSVAQLKGQADRGGAGEFGRLPPAHRAELRRA